MQDFSLLIRTNSYGSVNYKANLKNIFVSPYPTLFLRYGSVGRYFLIFFYFSGLIQTELCF